MASSVADRAANRAGQHEAAIRGFLADGESKLALFEAIRAITSECSKLLNGRRPGDGQLICAELAASLLATASQIYAYKPARPVGCRPGLPQPTDLLAMFEAQFAQAQEGGSHG